MDAPRHLSTKSYVNDNGAGQPLWVFYGDPQVPDINAILNILAAIPPASHPPSIREWAQNWRPKMIRAHWLPPLDDDATSVSGH